MSNPYQRQPTAGPVKPVWVVGDNTQTGGNTPVENIITHQPAWITLINAVRLDDDPTSFNSGIVNVEGYDSAWLLLDIDSTLAPTTVEFIPQFTNDGGTTWWDYREGIWASMVFEDTETASGLLQAFKIPLGGIDKMRMRIVGTGTDATNYFDVTVLIRAYR